MKYFLYKSFVFAVPYLIFLLGNCYFFNLTIEKFVSLKVLNICLGHENFDLIYIATLCLILGLNVNFCFSIRVRDYGDFGGDDFCCSGLFFIYCVLYSKFYCYVWSEA